MHTGTRRFWGKEHHWQSRGVLTEAWADLLLEEETSSSRCLRAKSTSVLNTLTGRCSLSPAPGLLVVISGSISHSTNMHEEPTTCRALFLGDAELSEKKFLPSGSLRSSMGTREVRSDGEHWQIPSVHPALPPALEMFFPSPLTVFFICKMWWWYWDDSMRFCLWSVSNSPWSTKGPTNGGYDGYFLGELRDTHKGVCYHPPQNTPQTAGRGTQPHHHFITFLYDFWQIQWPPVSPG